MYVSFCMEQIQTHASSESKGTLQEIGNQDQNCAVIGTKRGSLRVASKPDHRALREGICEGLGGSSSCTYDISTLTRPGWLRNYASSLRNCFCHLKHFMTWHLAQTLCHIPRQWIRADSNSGGSHLKGRGLPGGFSQQGALNEQIHAHTLHLKIRIISCPSWIYASRISSSLWLGRRKQIMVFISDVAVIKRVNSLPCCIYEVKNLMLSKSEMGNSYFSMLILITVRMVFVKSISPFIFQEVNLNFLFFFFFFCTYFLIGKACQICPDII